MSPPSCRVREIWASSSGRPSLPDRQGRTTSHRWEKKALTGARKRLFSSWQEENRIYLSKESELKQFIYHLLSVVWTCALFWMSAVSILSSHTRCMSVSRMWYAVSPNQLLACSWQPLMLTGSQGRWRRTSVGAPLASIVAQIQGTKQTKQKREIIHRLRLTVLSLQA